MASGSERELESVSRQLQRAMVALRRARPNLDRTQTHYVRYEDAMGGVFAQAWFLSRGCTWDRRGECTMCNYGVSDEVTATDQVAFIDEIFESLRDDIDELYVSPSGSLLDPREVPPVVLYHLLKKVAGSGVPRFSFETRVETVSGPSLAALSVALPGTSIAVGFGVESADPMVLEMCVNKSTSPEAFAAAVRTCHDAGIEAYANVSIGHAFLSERESLEDARRTTAFAFDAGADTVILFPLHVKRFTLLESLMAVGRYQPPSLWSLVGVLDALPADLLPRVTLSWYRSDYGVDSGVVASPDTCAVCREKVLEGLDRFRAEPSEANRASLGAIACQCRDRFRADVAEAPKRELEDRVREGLQVLRSQG